MDEMWDLVPSAREIFDAITRGQQVRVDRSSDNDEFMTDENEDDHPDRFLNVQDINAFMHDSDYGRFLVTELMKRIRQLESKEGARTICDCAALDEIMAMVDENITPMYQYPSSDMDEDVSSDEDTFLEEIQIMTSK